uniref:Protein kinase domain-containing protein n=1 Tax=Chromera velia CCMP2878 TaxID=1169474 RepID=A0A0G4H1K7_9ALVE|eukprot:Cvel_24281.t1-p1 / transcript=Cvel_24281.t1 / gene=Cvel_24281 / organism=Chromera_velia_CCMP2878 / gene_product=26S proteasome non-ATPase regulatory subunit 10, putative / transcript_product=26S proteasome non-ATPase regulatory subunit 10, putative / location=Cvel_scaffold2605:2334-10024(-) / protein_length=1100 / sequence_SO=supercontig / SO=protein_coding / is_pseudo=false
MAERKGRQLAQAAHDKDISGVRRLLREGAPINWRDPATGWTPLHAAARNGTPEIVETLARAGADVHAKNNDGVTPLHYTAIFGTAKMVEALVRAGADVRAEESNGMTPLHCVASNENGTPEMVETLVRAGADVQAKEGQFRWTPLHQAASNTNGTLEMVEALLRAGADVHVKDNDSEIAADIAEQRDNRDVATKLRDPHWCGRVRGENFPQNVHAITHGEGGATAAGETVTLQETAVQTETTNEKRPLQETAADLKARFLFLRGVGSEGKTEDGGLTGLPLPHWTDFVSVLRSLCSSQEVNLSDLLGRARTAVTSLKEALQRTDTFRDRQKELRDRVAAAASTEVRPVSEEEVRDRDHQRTGCLQFLESCLREGSQVAAELPELAAEGVKDDNPNLPPHTTTLADRLQASLEGIQAALGRDVVGATTSLDNLSLADIARSAVILAEEWQRQRGVEVVWRRAATEASIARVREALDLRMDGFPSACEELERVGGEEGKLRDLMGRLEDSVSLEGGGGGDWRGKDVVKQVTAAGRQVMDVSVLEKELKESLQKVEAAAVEFREGIALANPEKLQEGRQRLSSLLDAQKKEKKQIRKRERGIEDAVDSDESPSNTSQTEVERLQAELRELKKQAATNNFPAAIARQRAHLLSLASLHFPELLWEGGDFLSVTRHDVEAVANQGALLSAGVLLQGRSSRRDFRNEEVLSEPSPQTGSLARVLTCMDLQSRKWVLKRFQLGTTGEGSAAVRHFYRQVAMLHELQHPHLCPVVAVWQEGEYGFVQMPFYPGGDLAGWMRDRPAEGGRDAAASLRLAEDLLSALSFLHNKGKVHCDVKPLNLFLTERGRGVLGDFDGIKDVSENGQPRATTILHVTAHYLAPEVRAGGPASPKSDVFSAGMTLAELLGGGVLAQQPERQAALEQLLDRMRAENPSDRPTATQVLQDPLFSQIAVDTAQCVTCFEVVLQDRGIMCVSKSPDASLQHFMCTDCLNGHLQAQSSVDPEYSDVRARFKAIDCGVSCVAPGCPSNPFAHADLARLLRPEVLQQWEGVRLEAAEERVRAEMETAFKKRLRRALREDGAQRKVREITEEILTSSAPGLGAAKLL